MILRWMVALLSKWARRYQAFLDGHLLAVQVSVVTFVFLLILLAPRIFYTVQAGESAVLWRRFAGGVVLDRVYGEGLRIIPPWDKLTIYNVRLQQVTYEFTALSRDGLELQFEISVRYQPVLEDLPHLHQTIGTNYVQVLVVPEVQTVLRQVCGRYTPEEIYSTQHFIMMNALQMAVVNTAERYVLLDDLLLKRITLPASVQAAIEKKQAAKQDMEAFTYVVQREDKEADRKRIEAMGIRDFQSIISPGLTPNYLQFKGIEASLKLAESANAKVVIIGKSEDGLPLILDTRTDVPAKNASAYAQNFVWNGSPYLTNDFVTGAGTTTTDGVQDIKKRWQLPTRK